MSRFIVLEYITSGPRLVFYRTEGVGEIVLPAGIVCSTTHALDINVWVWTHMSAIVTTSTVL